MMADRVNSDGDCYEKGYGKSLTLTDWKISSRIPEYLDLFYNSTSM